MSQLKKEVDSYDRNVESLSKFKLELYHQLDDLQKSNTPVESKIDERNNYESPLKKPTTSIESNGSKSTNLTSESEPASTMLPVWRDLENNHTEIEEEVGNSNWHIIQIECDDSESNETEKQNAQLTTTEIGRLPEVEQEVEGA